MLRDLWHDASRYAMNIANFDDIALWKTFRLRQVIKGNQAKFQEFLASYGFKKCSQSRSQNKRKKNSWFYEHAHLRSTFPGEPCKQPNKSIAIYLIIFYLIINLVFICEIFFTNYLLYRKNSFDANMLQ